ETGKGRGLGLSTVFGIVRQAGGAIDVESEPGLGTTFRILFPAATPGTDSTSEKPVRRAAEPGSQTILLVEDDEQVRSAVKRVLSARGYRVIEARSGDSAVQGGGEPPGQEVPLALLLNGRGRAGGGGAR